jgi:lipopolysaccharide transport system permease protein
MPLGSAHSAGGSSGVWHALGYAVDVVRTLVERELKIRYKGSLLGLLWAVLSPLAMVLVLYFLFSQVVPLNIPHYAAFVYCGLLPWTWFQTSLQSGSSTLFDNRDLVRKPFFPRPLLPAVVMGTNFFLYQLALPVLLALLLADGVPLSPLLLLLPGVWLVQALFTLACTTLFAALGVLVRDVQHLLGVVLVFWFYLTPIFYDPSVVAPEYAQWLMLNPVAILVQAHRDVALYMQPPDWGALGVLGGISVVLLLASLWLFRVLEDAFVEEV